MSVLKKVFSKLSKLFSIVALTLLASAVLGVSLANAQTPPDVVFNNGKNIAGIGDESDFLRINNADGGNTAEVCQNGDQVNLWFYVHNTNPVELNGAPAYNGVGVARNTKVDINFGNEFSRSHRIDASVTADNAATAQDSATITCGNRDVQLEFVSQSFVQDSNAPSGVNYTLTGSIMDNATIGLPGGVFPGCFEYRAYIKVVVKVKIQEPEESTGVCKAIDDFTVDRSRRRVSLKVVGSVENAEITGYRIDWGDGSRSNQQTGSHTYDDDGTYIIRAFVRVKFANGDQRWISHDEDCVKEITFSADKPPVVKKPKALPDTGAGSLLGLFASTSVAAGLAHKYVWGRRYRN